MKHIFHTLESIGSARIEGNNTTIAEYIETKLEDNKNVSSDIKEIQNIEKAMEFIEDNIIDYPINKMFLSELHKMIVDGLLPPPNGEGDSTPGVYRGINLKINNETEYTSRHFAIAGINGSGKTQFVLDLINQISKQSNKELKFTFFDFKGTDSEEKLKPFLNSTSANFINVTHQNGFPFSPLKNYDLSNQNYIESFASDLRTFFKDIRQVQSASLVRHIIDYHFDNKESPTLNELFENLLENNNGKFDTTTSVIQQLINSRIYDESKTYDIFRQSNYISMPSDVTKEIKQFVTFNLLKFMYDTIKKSGDSKVVNNIRELKHVIIIDEAQNFLQHKNARPVIESMLRELRSMGIVIILIAQETQDFIYSDFDFMSQIKFSICCDVRDKSPKRIIPFIGTVNSEVKLKTQLDKLESGKGIINVGEPKLIELRQWWKTNTLK